MRLLDRYLIRSMAGGIGVVLLVLLALFSFITFANELGRVGRGDYGVWDALAYTVAMLPGQAYQLFPASVLIGTLMGLGGLAAHSELTAMRAAGVSLHAILRALLGLGLVLMLLMFALGEWLAPQAERHAQTQRSLALNNKMSLQSATGLWLREGDDIINIREILPGGRLRGVTVYHLDGVRIDQVLKARSARFEPSGRWRLQQVEQVWPGTGGMRIERHAQLLREGLLSPELLGVVSTEAGAMSLWELYRYVDFLRANGLESAAYRQAFWMKLVSPLSIMVMVILALPFVFGSLRTLSAGHRVLIGTLVGIGFYLLNQILNYAGLVFGLAPVATALAPLLLFLLLAMRLLRRVY